MMSTNQAVYMLSWLRNETVSLFYMVNLYYAILYYAS